MKALLKLLYHVRGTIDALIRKLQPTTYTIKWRYTGIYGNTISATCYGINLPTAGTYTVANNTCDDTNANGVWYTNGCP